MNNNLKDNENGKYLIDLKDHEGMIFYYSLKERFEYKLDNRDEKVEMIANSIKEYVNQFDNIIIPQSSSNFLELLLKKLNKSYIIINKSTIADVIKFCESLPLQKKERLSHLERISNMTDGFKINLMKATQRVKYEQIIFQKAVISDENGLIIDDSFFSGTTYRALKNIAPTYKYLSIFSK